MGSEMCIRDRHTDTPPSGVRVLFPPKMGTIPPQIMYFLCIVTCFDVSAMYLKCISSVVFGAFGRLVSLCMVRAAQASPDHGFCGVRARAGDPSS